MISELRDELRTEQYILKDELKGSQETPSTLEQWLSSAKHNPSSRSSSKKDDHNSDEKQTNSPTEQHSLHAFDKDRKTSSVNCDCIKDSCASCFDHGR